MACSKYRQILEELKGQIFGSRFGPSHPFPSESALARAKGVTRNTVHRAYAELRRMGLIEGDPGAVPRIARRAVSRKVGLIMPGASYSEFFQPIVGEISRLAQRHGYTLLFGNVASRNPVHRAAQAKRFANDLVEQGVAGVICQPLEFIDNAAERNADVLAVLDAARVPVVLIDYDIVPPPSRSRYDLVGINNFQAGSRLAAHLLSVGAKRVDFVMRPNCAWSVHARRDGVQAAVLREGRAAAFRALVAEPDDLAALRRHIAKGRPDAFVCGNDTVAAKFKQTLSRAGLRVPDDVLLAGFDDVQMTALLTPPLTTVRQPCAAIGARAFATLLRRIAQPGAEPQEICLSAQLVVRESTMRPPRERNLLKQVLRSPRMSDTMRP